METSNAITTEDAKTMLQGIADQKNDLWRPRGTTTPIEAGLGELRATRPEKRETLARAVRILIDEINDPKMDEHFIETMRSNNEYFYEVLDSVKNAFGLMGESIEEELEVHH